MFLGKNCAAIFRTDTEIKVILLGKFRFELGMDVVEKTSEMKFGLENRRKGIQHFLDRKGLPF